MPRRARSAVMAVLVTAWMALICPLASGETPATFSGSGGTNTSGAAFSAKNAFSAAIGGANNGGAPGPLSGGFRSVNWDGVPDSLASPQHLPPSFYLSTQPRGLLLAAADPGSYFAVSQSSGQTVFSDQNADYANQFVAFSPTRLFSPINSNRTEVSFYVPGTATHASVRGFGAIFDDVEAANTSSLELFSPSGPTLTKSFAPTGTTKSPEFLGVLYNTTQVGRVEITSGTVALPATESLPASDVVALDDFVYTEPQALPSPTLTVDQPSDGSTVSDPQLTVSGNAQDSAGLVSVTVNGTGVPVGTDGSWSRTITLAAGTNVIDVTATNVDGNQAEVTRTVTLSSGAPAPTTTTPPPATPPVVLHPVGFTGGVLHARKGAFTFRFTTDPGTAGSLVLQTRKAIAAKRTLVLGTFPFRASSKGVVAVKVKLSKTASRALKRLHKLPLIAVVHIGQQAESLTFDLR
jgi:Glucodextranase, domain B